MSLTGRGSPSFHTGLEIPNILSDPYSICIAEVLKLSQPGPDVANRLNNLYAICIIETLP